MKYPIMVCFLTIFSVLHAVLSASGSWSGTTMELGSLIAPNRYVSGAVRVIIEDISEPRIKTQEFDVDMILLIYANLTFSTCYACRKYLSHIGVSRPRPGELAYVGSSTPSDDASTATMFWFPELFFQQGPKVAYPSPLVPTYSTKYKNLEADMDDDLDCGAVYTVRRRVTVSCAMHFKYFPLDVQICPLTITSFWYVGQSFYMDWWAPQDMGASLLANPVPRLTEYSVDVYWTGFTPYPLLSGESSGIALEFCFKRNILSQMLASLLPSFLLVVCSFGVYLMPPTMASERIGFSSSTLLGLVTMYSNTRGAIPASPDLTSSDIWMLVNLVFVLLVASECCLVEYISSSEAEFEERRRRRETDQRKKDDLFRYVQVFRDRMPNRIATEPFGPAVTGVPRERPQTSIVNTRRRRALQRDVDLAIRSLLAYVDYVTPWFQLPWTAKRVDMYASRGFFGAYTIFVVVFWSYNIFIKYF